MKTRPHFLPTSTTRSALFRALLCLALLYLTTGTASGQPSEQPNATVDPRVEQALEKVGQDDLTGALEILEGIVEQGAELDARTASLLGSLYVETDRPAEALDVLGEMAKQEDAHPAVLYNAGRAAIATGDPQRGIQYLMRSVQLAPRSPARRELGMMLAMGGQYEPAYVQLRAWVAENPADQEARLLAALAAVQLERADDAERLLSELSQEEPRVKLLWGQTLLMKGDPWGALGYFRPLLADTPPEMESDVRRGAARAYTMVGESQSAIELLEGRVGDDPSMALQLSDAFYQNGNMSAALSVIQRFAEHLVEADTPEQAGGLGASISLHYGRLLLTDGRASEALPYLELATRLSPDDGQAWQTLAQALAADGEGERAQQALARAEELTARLPENDLAEQAAAQDSTARAIARAIDLMGRGQVEEAIGVLEREARLAPEDPRPPLIASRLLLVARRPTEALNAVENSLQLAPRNPDGHYQRGAVLMSLDRLDEAEASLRRALELNPEHTGAMSDLAVLLMEEGSKAEARALLEKVLELRPDDPLARENLERLGSSG